MDKLKIYTTSWCPDCRAAKRVLAEKNLDYEEIDLDKVPEAVATVVKARGKRVVPTLEFNGKFIDGNHFETAKFEKELTWLLS